MPLNPQSQEYRRQSLHLFYVLGKSVYDTLTDLKNLYADISFQEIDAWFTRFRNGSSDIETDIEFDPNARGLDHIPVNLKRKIMESVGYQDQSSLLKVNQEFRGVLEADRRLFKRIKLLLGINSFGLSAEYAGGVKTKEFKITRGEQGCVVCEDGNNTRSSSSYLDEGLRLFNEMIVKKGTKINRLVINSRKPQEVDEEFDNFHAGIGIKLGGLREKLHVEELEMRVGRRANLPPILDGVKTGVLTSMELYSHHEDLIVYELNDFPSLESHLKSLKGLWSSRIQFVVPPTIFEKVEHGSICLPVITPTDLEIFKNMMLKSPLFHEMTFYINYDKDQLLPALGPYDAAEDWDDYDGSLTEPSGDIIKFSFNSTPKWIDFKRERKNE